MRISWRQCIKDAQESILALFWKLRAGTKFQEIADGSISKLNSLRPHYVRRPMQYFLIFVLFHLYLLYAIVFAVAQFISLHTKVKGSRVIPVLPRFTAWKEKVIVFATSLFIWHWFSTSFLGVSAGWHHFTSWVLNLRPQINIKPQVKLVTSSEFCPSTKSSMSISVEDVDADVDVFLSPENKEVADAMKKYEIAEKSASFASDLISSVAGSISRSTSVESAADSAVSWSSYSDCEEALDNDEVDLDEELKKYNFSELPTDDGSTKPLLAECRGAETTTRPKKSLKKIANDVLTTVGWSFTLKYQD
ncbi:unnamed protein product [Cylicocyclus nassatus]|uniref:Uncharacterized protein n=1 Tax=Cylicocyclus nassatus TaxID=53992 RepID=A0AA36H8V5_CYLNA|nr:unnamed protein product [Cylicocyclus nassatus]